MIFEYNTRKLKDMEETTMFGSLENLLYFLLTFKNNKQTKSAELILYITRCKVSVLVLQDLLRKESATIECSDNINTGFQLKIM
jgi:hypothetical protein